MASFLKPLLVKVLDDGKYYELIEELSYYRESNKDDIIIIPKGFIFDGATVPRIFWTIIPPLGRYTRAACLHDYLIDVKWRKEKVITRKEADIIFLESMKAIKVNKLLAYTMYSAVRFYSIIKGYK